LIPASSPYSARSAAAELTEAARHANTKLATNAARPNAIDTTTNVGASHGLTGLLNFPSSQ
jgi:hypothetical protein